MKKILVVIILILLTGCVNYVELANIEVIENLAIDYQNNKYKIAVTTVEKEDEKKYEVKYSEGDTLTDAIKNLKMKQNKKIYIAHLNLLLLTENIVDNNLEDVIKFFLNNSESRNDFDVAITKSLDVLNETNDIKNQIQIIEEDLATTKSILFEEFFSDILEEKTTYLPVVFETDKVEGIAIIRRYKNKIYISKEECILYNFMDNSIKQSVFKETPILSSVTTSSFRDNILNSEITLTSSVSDKKIEDQLEDDIKEMFNKYKDKNIDIFNIDEKICKKNQKYCSKHKNFLFEDIKFNVNVKLENKFINDMEVKFR